MDADAPSLALTVVRERGMSFAACHACWLGCEAHARTTDAAMAQLPCRVGMRDWVADQMERERHGATGWEALGDGGA